MKTDNPITISSFRSEIEQLISIQVGLGISPIKMCVTQEWMDEIGLTKIELESWMLTEFDVKVSVVDEFSWSSVQ